VTELHEAGENIELAVLSAIEYARNADIALSARIAATAVVASAHIDDQRCRRYFDLVMISLAKGNPGILEATMDLLNHEYESDFARRYVAQGRTEGIAEGKVEGRTEGRTEGRVEGRIEMLLKLLALRYGPLAKPVEARIRNLQDAQLDAVVERALTVQTLEEALGPQC
jgi:predicted transposase YdaD